MKNYHLTDIIILVCYSLSLFTYHIRLLMSRLQVQVLSGAPALSTDYRELGTMTNRFTFGGFTVTYSPFQMAWEVVEKRDGYEVAFRWITSKLRAEKFCLGRIAAK